MTTKVPEDAFAFYFALGPDRSYAAVAEHYGVSKRAITKRAAKEDWSGRLEAANHKAREKLDQSVVGSLEAMNERHLKVARAIQAKALEALRQMPLERAMDAVKALDIGVRQERLVVGEPTDRSVVSIEETIKKQFASWMLADGESEESGAYPFGAPPSASTLAAKPRARPAPALLDDDTDEDDAT
jgi:hypothetical protein